MRSKPWRKQRTHTNLWLKTSILPTKTTVVWISSAIALSDHRLPIPSTMKYVLKWLLTVSSMINPCNSKQTNNFKIRNHLVSSKKATLNFLIAHHKFLVLRSKGKKCKIKFWIRKLLDKTQVQLKTLVKMEWTKSMHRRCNNLLWLAVKRVFRPNRV